MIPHLFRIEYRKIVAVLCRRFGLEQIEIAEDIASETFLTASQTWGIGGIPENPVAWLYSVAKNKAKNQLQRTRTFSEKVLPALENEGLEMPEMDMSPEHIEDSQLRMMFAICHPSISAEMQISLSLRILCGFGIDEIAAAFLSNKENIQKRLFRAKEKLREAGVRLELPSSPMMEKRLAAVLTTIYLLFNEGYYSSCEDQVMRKDLCLEAMRLCHMLAENNTTNLPQVNALLSMMYFHASRFEARLKQNGELILYEDQDTDLWNQELIKRGSFFLKKSAIGNNMSRYHLEAEIAFYHTQKIDSPEKWEAILHCYNRLLEVHYSPIAALNRTYALYKATGKEVAIAEAETLQLYNNPFYFGLLGTLYTGIDNQKAKSNFSLALQHAKSAAAKQVIQKKIDLL